MGSYITDPETLKLCKRLNFKVFEIRSLFIVWKYLHSIINATVVGRDSAEKNLELVNRHVGFFNPTSKAIQSTLIIDLHKLFTSKKNEVNIPNLLVALTARSKNYSEEFTQLQNSFETELGLIEKARNKLYAHEEDREPTFTIPAVTKIGELIEELAALLNKISSECFGVSWVFQDEISLQAASDTQLLIDNLIRGESARIAQIDAEYQNRVYYRP